MGALRDMEATLKSRLMFWVDNDRVLQWRDLSAAANSGVHLTEERNLSGMTISTDNSEWAMRVYSTGARDENRVITMGDGLQGWSVYLEASEPGRATLRYVAPGFDNPSELVGYEGVESRVGEGDFLGQGTTESEIKRVVTRGLESVVVELYDETLELVVGAGRLERRHLDSPLYGMDHRQILRLDNNEFDPRGVSDYDLHVEVVSGAFASMGQNANGRTARILFLSADAQIVLDTVVTTLDYVTGEIDATVTIPFVSGTRKTIIFMVLGWEVT